MRDFFVPRDMLLYGSQAAMPEDFSVRGFPAGQSEASATLTVTVSSAGAFIYHDDFDVLDSNYWDVSGLASAVATNSELVTEGRANTLGTALDLISASYLGLIPDNFEINAELSWVSRSSCLGQMYIALKSSSGLFAYVGVNDSWSNSTPGKGAAIDTDTFSSGMNSLPSSGTCTLKIRFSEGALELYFNDVLLKSGAFPDVVGIYLTNNRFQTYNGNTAKWAYFHLDSI